MDAAEIARSRTGKRERDETDHVEVGAWICSETRKSRVESGDGDDAPFEECRSVNCLFAEGGLAAREWGSITAHHCLPIN
jgi:hypothetical protein